ncbi:ParB/RepB/Spo0J family partition protein [Sphingomonas gilva]|uniref:ParB/RepB/Spo0J family partition protein n=1 Tax=Sphingomonas gilva TaxID=2305907 RepID=A0A396S2T7_9SPHN|nr:ParB/RepB/Spo0J family partition protein [Sphingomonas gilva]RHW17685.1 ParB/RepB/Spo0J family partition protein [Sphingomonas gilva]
MSEAARGKRPAGLGRGLSALLGDVAREQPIGPQQDGAPADGSIRMLPVGAIAPHPEQPRRHFDDAALDELARSIGARGVIQPIVVRPKDDRYQIVAGERRWRAAQRAHLHEIPAIVRDFTEAETLEIALVENIQREDLNAVEEAQAYAKLIGQFGHTQEALARLVHKSRSHVANLLRLLELPKPVLDHVVRGEIQMGHARALVGAPEAEALADRIAEEGLSVREAESLARAAKGSRRPRQAPLEFKSMPSDVAALETQLGDLLGLKVRIAHSPKGGTLSLAYSTLDQLDMICQRLSGERI